MRTPAGDSPRWASSWASDANKMATPPTVENTEMPRPEKMEKIVIHSAALFAALRVGEPATWATCVVVAVTMAALQPLLTRSGLPNTHIAGGSRLATLAI